jgi:hypothetical protein
VRRAVVQRVGALAGNRAAVALQRETAQEVIDRYMNYGGLNLQEEELGAYLAGRARAGDYAIATAVIGELPSSDKDDVATETVRLLSTPEVVRMARNPAAVTMLRVMKDQMTDWWSWVVTEEEQRLADLIAAVLGDEGARRRWNVARIEATKGTAGSDLAALAALYADDEIVDEGTLASRTAAVLDATANPVVPGLQTGIAFGDTGFAGDQNPGGAGFRDPHASSRNQVGHFLTAVGLQVAPDLVSRPIPEIRLVRAALGVPTGSTVRELVGAPPGLSDDDVALRLTIGHEKAPDPPGGAEAGLGILFAGLGESLTPGPEGETEEEEDERVGQAMLEETRQQVRAVIGAFRAQFQACTDEDVAAWNRAITALGTADTLNLGAAEPELARVAINFAQKGNSIQDLRLSLVGWRFGQMLRTNAFGDDRRRVAAWLRTNLGPQ